MLEGPSKKDTPLKDSLLLTFQMTQVSESIPRFVKKALGILRREANIIRQENEDELLPDV